MRRRQLDNNENEMREQVMQVNKKMPREQLEAHLIEFIKSNNVCVLSTSKDDIPRSTPVTYYSEGTTLYILTDQGSTKLDNIEANPRISIGISAPRTSWLSVKGLQITGQVTLITAGNPGFEEALTVYNFQERVKENMQEMRKALGKDTEKEIPLIKPPKSLVVMKVESKKIELCEYALLPRGYDFRQIWEA
jgi:nitroimidazol reductase NimA-like FMN-containing flavoprotein (pyridoxamine 5'-phosphate oxidase superfamily)